MAEVDEASVIYSAVRRTTAIPGWAREMSPSTASRWASAQRKKDRCCRRAWKAATLLGSARTGGPYPADGKRVSLVVLISWVSQQTCLAQTFLPKIELCNVEPQLLAV